MPRKFSTQVILSDGLGVHSFGPGDDVPSWATKVGEHVLEPLNDTDDVEDDDTEPETVETVVKEEQGPPAPDFTKPVPEKRGPGRPRKN